MAFGPCANCREVFGFNPDWVPSIKLDPEGHPAEDGTRRPLCRACAHKLQEILVAAGQAAPPIHPLAYEPEECP